MSEMRFDPTNEIDPAVRIACAVRMGRFNYIGPHVTIAPFKGGEAGPVSIGDCNRIEEGVRLLVGPGGLRMGDWNVLHNHTTISGGPGGFRMGHNCWVGQESYLDCSGGLTLGDGVTCGICTVIWTHIGRGEQVEGWLCRYLPVILDDDVWLIGDNVHISPGVRMKARSVALAHSVVVRDAEPDTVYAGVPARKTDLRLREEVTPGQKLAMMRRWAEEFCQAHGGDMTDIQEGDGHFTRFVIERDGDSLAIWMGLPRGGEMGESETHFDLAIKTYTKRLTLLERDFVRYLSDHKARFLPGGG